MKRHCVCLAVCLAGLLVVDTVAGVINGYTLSDGGLLEDVTVDGTTHQATSLTVGALTGIVDANAAQLMLKPADAVPTPHTSVLSDLRIDSGVLNVSSATFTFSQPIVNIGGIDLLLWDWGGWANDDFNVTINGQDSGVIGYNSLPAGGAYAEILSPVVDAEYVVSSQTGGFSTVAAFNALTFNAARSSSAQLSRVIGLDLTDFGVAANGTIDTVRLDDTDASIDPMLVSGIQGVPEPGTMVLVLIGFAAALVRRRWA